MVEMKRYDILHNDLKPANILLTKRYDFNICRNVRGGGMLNNAEAKIADFGNGISRKMVDADKDVFKHSFPTRYYLSPEILIGADYWVASDMWSLGCIIYELLTGDELFDPERDNNMGVNSAHLATMVKTFGPVPMEVLQSGKYSKKYFDMTNGVHRFNYLIGRNVPLRVLLKRAGYDSAIAEAAEEFLLPIFNYDQKKRITPEECLKSRWLRF